MGLEKYYENPALSQSKLKLLLNNPKLFNTIQEPEMYFEEKKYFTIGSAVDCLLTQSQEEFDNQYHISNIQNKPSDTIKSIINQVFDIVVEQNYNIIGSITAYTDIVLICCNEHEYQQRWNEQTRINKICESWEYWEDLKQAIGKKILSQDESNLISQIVMSIRTNEVTSKYFQKDILTEIIFQMPIDFIYEDINCKALLDMVIINHKDRTIQPIDIKTMGDYTINFSKSLKQNRLDIQASYYTEALKSVKAYESYVILPFKFIVESTIDVGNPLVFTCSQELLNIGKYGRPSLHIVGTTDTNNYLTAQFIAIHYNEIKGFYELIDDYKWYLENGFEKSKRVVEFQGEFNLDWDGII